MFSIVIIMLMSIKNLHFLHFLHQRWHYRKFNKSIKNNITP